MCLYATLLITERTTLPESVLTTDSARTKQNAAVSIRGTRQRLAKEILCKMAADKSSKSIFSGTRQACPVS